MATLYEIMAASGLKLKMTPADEEKVKRILEKSEYRNAITVGRIRGFCIDGYDVNELGEYVKNVYLYGSIEAAQELKREKERIQKEKEELLKNVDDIMITSGYSFEGYKIVKYSGYISGDDAVSVPREYTFFADNAIKTADRLTESLVKIRKQALKELKEAAALLGCNAVIGVDFDYITLDPQNREFITGQTNYQPYVFCVTANGTAVKIEKE
ncbi:MAG: heavy metal-binding domain-containing protein [Mogibacterium sp.]|nr:heavy metal-binding domain-containing protein [Mogibacterium sp.]